MIKNVKNWVLNNNIILKSLQRFKSDYHNIFAEQTNKIVSSSIKS